MHRQQNVSFILILAIGASISGQTQNNQVYTIFPQSSRQADSGKFDYETALRPAVLQKRSIANIARLLIGGNVPSNHPLVQYPEPKSWNLANNIIASFPSSSSSTNSEGWLYQPGSAIQKLHQLFQTKAKIIPLTGQVATGLTGVASVKGDLIRQIHSISTQAIAQAASEATAKVLATATAAHSITNSIAQSVKSGAQPGIKGDWSNFQNVYTEPAKTQLEPPGPPLKSNGYYTLYDTQQSYQNDQPLPRNHVSSTQPPSILIATTPDYSAFQSNPVLPIRQGKSLPVIVYKPSSNNAPSTSFGRNVVQPSSTSSLLSSISSLLSESSAAAAHNTEIAGSNSNQPRPQHHPPHQYQQQQQESPSLLSSGIGASSIFNNDYHQQPIIPLFQASDHNENSPGYLQHPAPGRPCSSNEPARATSTNPPNYSFQQEPSNLGANSYISHAIQSSPQYGNDLDRFSTVPGANSGAPGYNGYNRGDGSGTGHAGGGWNTQHAGLSASTWPAGNGHAGPTPGYFNNSPGGFGGGPQQSPAQSTSPQQAYPPTYQSPAPNFFADTQQQPQQYPQQMSSSSTNANQYHTTGHAMTIAIDGIRNPDISQQRNQPASHLRNDYNNDHVYHEKTSHNSYQKEERRHHQPPPNNSYSGTRHPIPSKKGLSKPPSNFDLGSNKINQHKSPYHHHHKSKHDNSKAKGIATQIRKAPPKIVRGNGGGLERTHGQHDKTKGSHVPNQRKKKGPIGHVREKENWRKQKPKTEHRGKFRSKSQPVQYKSNDVYTTLPEYVFRVGERPDVFLRPSRKRKKKFPFRLRGVIPRLGETDEGDSDDATEEEELLIMSPPDHHDDDNTASESSPEAKEEEEYASDSETIDEADGDDIMSDQIAKPSGLISDLSKHSQNSIPLVPNTRHHVVAPATGISNPHNSPQSHARNSNIKFNENKKLDSSIANFQNVISQTIGLPPVSKTESKNIIDAANGKHINNYKPLQIHNYRQPVLIPAVSLFSTSFI